MTDAEIAAREVLALAISLGYDTDVGEWDDCLVMADHLIAAGFRREPAGAVEGWRDISSAPKDGTAFLAWPAHLEGGVVAAVEARWYVHLAVSGWITDAFDCGDYEFEPTHWMPLPAAPTPGASDAE